MRYFKLTLIVAMAVLTTSCSRYKQNEDLYTKAHGDHKIVVPAGAVAPVQEPYDPVPGVAAAERPLGNRSFVPPGSHIQQYRDEKKSKK